MDEIEVVIRIPKEEYHYIQLYGGIKPFSGNFIAKQIKKGTVLPKGHGELKDISNLKYVFDLTREDPIYSGKDIERAVKTMKSIIEADKEDVEWK